MSKQNIAHFWCCSQSNAAGKGPGQPGMVQQSHLITTQAPMLNSQGQLVNPIQVRQIANYKMLLYA
jgi:hypothetical protein